MGFVCITGAFAEIDWHDYAIVQTIEFTAADATSELPPPMSLQEVENMTLAQKRMAAMVMETTVEDVEALRAKQAQEAAEAAIQAQQEDEAAMEESDDEDKEENERRRREEEERQRELERARAIQASSLEAGGPMKIRTDYVPKRELYSIARTRGILIVAYYFYSSFLQKGREAHYVYYLWSANPRGRTARTHAYRAARSPLEITT